MGEYLSRDAILAAEDLPREVVHVLAWGGDVLVQGLTADELDQFELSFMKPKPGGKEGEIELDRRSVRARLVARTVVDAQGQRVFTDADIEALGRKSGAALDRIAQVAERLSGGLFSARRQEALEKNSSGA